MECSSLLKLVDQQEGDIAVTVTAAYVAMLERALLEKDAELERVKRELAKAHGGQSAVSKVW